MRRDQNNLRLTQNIQTNSIIIIDRKRQDRGRPATSPLSAYETVSNLMRATLKSTQSLWRTHQHRLQTKPQQIRKGSIMLVIGILTQFFLLFTLFDSNNQPSIPTLSYFSSVSPFSSPKTTYASPPSTLTSTPTEVNYPIYFERQLTPDYNSYHPEYDDPSILTVPDVRRIGKLKCIQIVGVKGLQSIEGIGAVFRLNQLAVFLASYYKKKLAFPSRSSEHDYDLSEMFSDCGYSKTYMDFPEHCTLDQEKVFIEECSAGDCHCLGKQLHPYVSNLVNNNNCDIIGILSDRYKTQQFSGCLQPLLYRYFGTQKLSKHVRKPDWEYDVIHYRHGDLAEKPGGKSFAPYQFEHLMRTLCDLSTRDIIILTENHPPVPHCSNMSRVFVANASVQHAFAVIQHAKHVAVGLGGFSIVLAEMAKPVRMIMLDLHVGFFRWLPCNKWSVVTGSGARFHFNSRAHMLSYALSNANLHRERFLNPGDIKLKRLNWLVPTRMWTPQLMAPLNLD